MKHQHEIGCDRNQIFYVLQVAQWKTTNVETRAISIISVIKISKLIQQPTWSNGQLAWSITNEFVDRSAPTDWSPSGQTVKVII